MFRLHDAIQNAVTPRAGTNMPQREFGHSPGQKNPVADPRLITPLQSDRDDWFVGSVQSPTDQLLREYTPSSMD